MTRMRVHVTQLHGGPVALSTSVDTAATSGGGGWRTSDISNPNSYANIHQDVKRGSISHFINFLPSIDGGVELDNLGRMKGHVGNLQSVVVPAMEFIGLLSVNMSTWKHVGVERTCEVTARSLHGLHHRSSRVAVGLGLRQKGGPSKCEFAGLVTLPIALARRLVCWPIGSEAFSCSHTAARRSPKKFGECKGRVDAWPSIGGAPIRSARKGCPWLVREPH